jgi:hypothetical protein
VRTAASGSDSDERRSISPGVRNARKAARYACSLLTALGGDFESRPSWAIEAETMTPQPTMPHFGVHGSYVTMACSGWVKTPIEVAAEIATKSPDAIRAAKHLLDASGVVSVADGLRLEEKLQLGLIGRPNQIESVRANLEKRAPRFQDPS